MRSVMSNHIRGTLRARDQSMLAKNVFSFLAELSVLLTLVAFMLAYNGANVCAAESLRNLRERPLLCCPAPLPRSKSYSTFMT